MTLSAWLCVIRVRFLIASVISVSVGLATSLQYGSIDLFSFILTMGGVLFLHASVDLLNDYWDFKRGIDTKHNTKMSGGTGVLPNGLLKPSSVYRAGIIFLILGGIVGVYFIITHGVVIALILGFAILSIWFYSGKIVDSGLAELFVGLKGSLIVIGAFFIQTGFIDSTAISGGVAIGILSSLVLYITSFPDHDADKAHGRKTLVIIFGKNQAAKLFPIFSIMYICVISLGVISGVFPVFCLVSFFAIPLIVWSSISLRDNFDGDSISLIPAMKKALLFSRISGMLFMLGFIIDSMIYINPILDLDMI